MLGKALFYNFTREVTVPVSSQWQDNAKRCVNIILIPVPLNTQTCSTAGKQEINYALLHIISIMHRLI